MLGRAGAWPSIKTQTDPLPKADLPGVDGRLRHGQQADDFNQRGQLLVVGADSGLEFGQFGREGLVINEHLAQTG